MATALKDALRTIQTHRNLSPHYAELLDILEEILILREEYRGRMRDEIFPVNPKLIEAKMVGGFPLIDFSSVTSDLAEPQAYFLALLEIAEKRAPGETGEMARKIRAGEILFNDLIHESFNSPAESTDDETPGSEEEASFDLVELFIEESLRPAFGDGLGTLRRSRPKVGLDGGLLPRLRPGTEDRRDPGR